MTGPGFAPQERPVASVILVTHNAAGWVAAALAALAANTPEPVELIVVDNASKDGTAELVAEIEGALVLRNTSNLGFGPAVDQAAMRARSPYLLLLNSDALVRPGWLAPLLAVAGAEADVGAVSSKLLHLDGRLQEAGSILWRDGLVSPYGDGADPHDAEYSFLRDVDYASAACLLVRRSAFATCGGFDPVFRPAYFEDVDLCLRLRSAGLRTVYQPLSEVAHVRWGSGSMEMTRRLVARNHPRFVRRWRGLLAHRPARPLRPQAVQLLGGRDALCSERLLVIGTSGGATAASASAVARLGAGARVTLAALTGLDPSVAASLRAAGVEVVGGERNWETWLATRRHHYGVVVAVADAADAVAATTLAQVRATQPQAAWVTPGEGAVLASQLREAGMLPAP